MKHDLTCRKPTYLVDSLVAYVVINKLLSTRAFYTTAIKRREKILVGAVSKWRFIDARTLEPIRLRDDVAQLFYQSTAAKVALEVSKR